MDNKGKKSKVEKVYFGGQWEKEQDGSVWVFFDKGEDVTETIEEKKEKKSEPEPELPEAPPSSDNKEVISITDIGLSTLDPRYIRSLQKIELPKEFTQQEKVEAKTEVKSQEKTELQKEITVKPSIVQKEIKTTVEKKKLPSQDYAARIVDIMLQSKKKQGEDIRKKENLIKIRSVIYDLSMQGFSFFSLMFDRDTSISSSNFKKMGKIIQNDPALSLKIIQIANSPYYGLSQKIFNVVKALNMLGLDRAKQIVAQASSSTLFQKIRKKELFKQLWYHSLGTGVFAKFLAREKGVSQDEMFMLGMMHDIGKVILYVSLPEQYEEVVKSVKENPVLLIDAEKDFFGIDHCEVGRMTLEQWKLPEQIINAAQFHHDLEPVQNPHCLKQLAIVQAADVLCNLSRIGHIGAKRTQLFDKKTKALMGKIESQKLTEEVKEEIKDIENLLQSE